jgi:hypothetical protein
MSDSHQPEMLTVMDAPGFEQSADSVEKAAVRLH